MKVCFFFSQCTHSDGIIDDGSEGPELCLPDELLSLLEASHSGMIDSDIYGGDALDYLLGGRDRRRTDKGLSSSTCLF